MTIEATGTTSNRPIAHITATHIPLNALEPYLPIARWFKGEVGAQADISRGGAYSFWKLLILATDVKADIPLPFPSIKVEGFFHPYVPSVLKLTFTGKPTLVNVKINIKDFRSKKVALTIDSRDADINEVIQWCRTGYWLNEAPLGTMKLPPESRWPVVWQITGRGDIDAKLISVMGPDLIKAGDGEVKFRIEKGRLSGMPGLIKTFALLNLSAMLGDKNKPPNGLEFETVNGYVDVQNGVARTRGVILLESPTLNLGVTGQVDFGKQVINAQMLIGVANLGEAFIAHIPFVRRFKSGDKKGVIPIWLGISGPLNDPEITLLPLRTFDRRMWKVLPAPFQVPDNVLKGIYEKPAR
jgi:hypothetical protein